MVSIFNGFEKQMIMNNLEYRVKTNLLKRGFTEEQLLNNRGLIGAAIDETRDEIVKNINYDTVLCVLCPDCNGERYVLHEFGNYDKQICKKCSGKGHVTP
jgi:hypothetical protein